MTYVLDLMLFCRYVYYGDMFSFWVVLGAYSQIEDTVFDGVKVRLYKPRGLAVGVPGLVFFHGGGWAFLDPGKKKHLR